MKPFAPPTLRLRLRAVLRLLALAAFAFQLATAQQPSSPKPQQEPSREPILRIETGMHTAPIKRIGVDAANRYLVTVSHDKTARVWELPSGRLLRVIRVPIGAGDEGKLHAVALSPDGSTIAAGGWTKAETGSHNIYLFDRESGRLLRRIGGLPNIVNHLSYSPDGRYLVATLGEGGVRVFSAATYAPAGEDRDYGSHSYGANFDRAGRLATTSLDGFIRLYAPVSNGPLRLIAKQKAAGGEHPFSVSFSPDGSRVAVGFDDSTRVAVLSGTDLSPLYAPDTGGVNNGDLFSVAWSADGRTLYAGGKAQDANGNIFIRVWTDGGRGTYRDIVAATNTILHILSLRDGGVIYGASDPAFGALDASGRRRLFTSAQIADSRGLLQNFLLAPDGAGVAFGYEYGGKSPARFSLAERRLDAAPAGSTDWRTPVTEAEGFRVTDWEDTYEPELNGTRLELKQYEFSRSLAIAPDRSTFLLGTEWRILLFDRNGTERWNVQAPGIAWAVNISADGRFAVAAYGDGTIRWYSMKDGKELLAFFPHADQKRWVVWTPSGYYDASPGGEELIGWHVNNGREQAADFFDVGRFRETFYRPDVVAKVLQTGDEQLALKLANEERGRTSPQPVASVSAMLPPVVDILTPSDGAHVLAGEITVRYRLRSPTGDPVTGIMAMVDGRPVTIESSLNLAVGKEGVERSVTVKVPPGASLLTVLATNRHAPSVPSVVQVSTRKRANEATAAKPKLFLLAIGVSKYSNVKGLTFPAKDAADFAALMQSQKGVRYSDVDAHVLSDPDRGKIMDELEWISTATTEADVAMIFLSGHGAKDTGGFYYFLPADGDPYQLKKSGVPFGEIINTFATIRGQKVLFVDTCLSGQVLGPKGVIDINYIVNKLNEATQGVAVFAASTGYAPGFEKKEWGNGAFTKALIEGLRGLADTERTGEVTFSLLEEYISWRVPDLTEKIQTPSATKPITVPNFTLASVKY